MISLFILNYARINILYIIDENNPRIGMDRILELISISDLIKVSDKTLFKYSKPIVY